MKEQKHVVKNMQAFDVTHIFECGQCFRWNKIDNNTYIGVIKEGVLEVKQLDNKIIFEGMLEGDIKEIVDNYFDFDTDYEEIKNKLSKIDEQMKKSVEYGYGIRILKQDLWECIISFIISANNNIPRIKGIIERLSKKCGKLIEYKKKDYYLFPEIDELSKLSIQDLRELGLGFRDKRVYKTCQILKSKEIDLDELKNMEDSNKIREKLLMLDGVGPKVADCIMLFSLKMFDVFPIDVWVRRVVNDLYIHNPDETKVNKKEIYKIADEKFGSICGLAQQYLFYWRRDIS